MNPNETIQEAIDLLAEALDDAAERVYDAKHALEALLIQLKKEAEVDHE